MSKKFKPQIFREIRLKVFTDDGAHEKFVLNPERGKLFTLAGIEKAKTDTAHLLMQQFPGRYFKFVKIKQNSYNVIPVKAALVVEAGEA